MYSRFSGLIIYIPKKDIKIVIMLWLVIHVTHPHAVSEPSDCVSTTFSILILS